MYLGYAVAMYTLIETAERIKSADRLARDIKLTPTHTNKEDE